jgi:predicted transcriptional regulator
MKIKNFRKPTEAELEILQILWKKHPATVKYVHEQLKKNKNVGYTTALKFMQIMTEKKLLDRFEEGRKHIYSPAVDEKEMQYMLLDGFLNSAFGGSASKLVVQLLGNYRPNKDELDKIKKLINNLEGEEK